MFQGRTISASHTEYMKINKQSAFCVSFFLSFLSHQTKTMLQMEINTLSCVVIVVHPWPHSLYPHCLFPSRCFHVMFSSIQLSHLIKGRAALPRSQRACLIFCSLSCVKKEGT